MSCEECEGPHAGVGTCAVCGDDHTGIALDADYDFCEQVKLWRLGADANNGLDRIVMSLIDGAWTVTFRSPGVSDEAVGVALLKAAEMGIPALPVTP